MQPEIPDTDAVAPPEHLVRIVHFDIFNLDVVHFPKHLRCVYDCILHRQMVGIPQCGASANGEVAVLYGKPVHVPKGVVSLEAAVGRYDVAAFLDGRFASKDGYVVQVHIMRGEQRTFASKFFVFNQLHIIYRSSLLFIIQVFMSRTSSVEIKAHISDICLLEPGCHCIDYPVLFVRHKAVHQDNHRIGFAGA